MSVLSKGGSVRDLSHHLLGEQTRKQPDPTKYSSNQNMYKLATLKSIPKYTVRQAKMPSEFGYVQPRQPKPDMATYTPRAYPTRAFSIN